VVAQVTLYYLFLIRQWKPPTAAFWWLGYFGSGYVIWLLEWRLEPALQWTGWAYLGQMFGVMRPGYSIPYSLLVFMTYFGIRFDWKLLAHLRTWEVLGQVSFVVTITLLGTFLYRLVTTSTERARLIQELEEAKAGLERARQTDAELAGLRERERLARDLHDSLGHGLVTLTVQLEAVQRLCTVDPARAIALLDEMKQLARGSMQQLRRSLEGLRAPGLGNHSLLGALRELCGQPRASLTVHLQAPSKEIEITPVVAEALWRIAQEGLTNVERHAHARTAIVCLEVQPQAIALVVTDDGIGAAPHLESQPGHYGLRGLRERAEGLGGQLAVSRNAPSGTILRASIPLIHR
jgi:signal transduction histidine kinase